MSDSLRPMDYSPPGTCVHGIFQARILEWVAISFSRRSSQSRDWTQISHIVGRRFNIWATREVIQANTIQTPAVDYKMVKNLPEIQETQVWSLGQKDLTWWRSSWSDEGNDNQSTPCQYSCLENSMDRGTWWATVHGVPNSQSQLCD